LRIELSHSLNGSEAIRRLDTFLESLIAREWPHGIEVTDARKQWAGNRMTFGFAVGKGGFSTSIEGTVDVDDGRVVLESPLPALARLFVGEDRIREAVARELRRALEVPGS
jgi:hypothetical protein